MRRLTMTAVVVLGAGLAVSGCVTNRQVLAAQQPAPVNELVVSAPAAQVDITIYGGVFAQVQETRTVSLKAGRNRVQLNGIAAHYRTDSLRLLEAKGPGTFAYRSATYQPANLTNDRLLAESVGKKIKTWRWTENGVKEVNGVLQSANGSALVVKLDSGGTELVNNSNVQLLETPSGLSNTPALVVEADVTTGGDYAIEFLYETEGLSWVAKHSLILDEENSKVTSWEASVSLANESGTSFQNATVRLLSGRVAAASAPGGLYNADRMALRAAPAPVEQESAAVENVGDQKVYTLPGTVSLTAGQTRQVPLFNGKNVPVKRQYVAGTPTSYSASGKYGAEIRLTVENCEKHNLGKPIPSGLVKVYQYNTAGKLQLTGSTHVGEKAQDEVFDLNVGTSSDVKWEVKLASVTQVAGLGNEADNPRPVAPRQQGAPPARVLVDPTEAEPVAPPAAKEQYEDRVYEVVVYNYKRDKDVTVKVEVSVPAKQQLDPKWKRPRPDRAETELNVPKSGSTSVQYTVRTRTR